MTPFRSWPLYFEPSGIYDIVLVIYQSLEYVAGNALSRLLCTAIDFFRNHPDVLGNLVRMIISTISR